MLAFLSCTQLDEADQARCQSVHLCPLNGSFLISVSKSINSNCEQQVDWISLNPETRDFSVIWIIKRIRSWGNIMMSPVRSLIWCFFRCFGSDQSGLCCTETNVHELPGSPAPSLSSLHSSSLLSGLSIVDVSSYSSGCLQTATTREYYPLHPPLYVILTVESWIIRFVFRLNASSHCRTLGRGCSWTWDLMNLNSTRLDSIPLKTENRTYLRLGLKIACLNLERMCKKLW